jgi:hypothetical protein
MRLTPLVGVILVFTVAPAAAQAPDVQFVCEAFSTDLPLAESKEPIHRLRLTCRLADGGSGTLSLDPSVPKFNEFGDRADDGKPSAPVTLDCTLKLTKTDNGRQLFEIRGPKIVTRLSLVVEKDIAPWGDGRLLVHGKGGKVRYVVDLYLPRAKPKPGGAAGKQRVP